MIMVDAGVDDLIYHRYYQYHCTSISFSHMKLTDLGYLESTSNPVSRVGNSNVKLQLLVL